jgi:membrane dipeptidase
VTAVFDGHNDALTREDADRFATGREGGHLDLPRAREGGLAGGVFAVFTDTPGHEDLDFAQEDGSYFVDVTPPVEHEHAAADAARALGRLLALERAGHVAIARRAGDLDRAREAGVLAAVAHLEGAEAIDPGLEALEFPASPDSGPGLTAAGRALVGRCAELGIAVDLSHLNEAGFWDVAKLDAAPLIASHSGAHALCASSRNLTDAQIDAIGASGGLVGVVFAVSFLRSDGRDDPDTPLETIVAHVRHVADRIGVAHVALGSDFDGATMPTALGDVAGLPRLLDALRAGGFTEPELRAIAWDNWRRVLEAAWG